MTDHNQDSSSHNTHNAQDSGENGASYVASNQKANQGRQMDVSQYQTGVDGSDYDNELKDLEVEQLIHKRMADAEADKAVEPLDHYKGEVRLKVPGVHHDYYANHNPTLEEMRQKDLGDDGFSMEEAERFAMRQGLHSTIVENARLHKDLQDAKKARQRSLLVTICLSLLLATLLYGFTQYPKTKYIATKDNTAICGVDAHNNPNITDPQIADFAKDAVLQIYTLDYVNYADQVEASLSRYFTPSGRQAQVHAFSLAGTLDDVSKNAVTLRAGAANAPRIEEKGVGNDGKPFWVVRFPMVIDSYSGSSTPIKTSKFIASVTVKADTATAQNPTGLGVETVNLIPQ